MISRTAKIYLVVIGLFLVILLGTGVQSTKIRQEASVSTVSSQWLFNVRNRLGIRLKDVSGPILKVENDEINLDPLIDLAPPPPEDEPPVVRGIYLTGWMAGNPQFVDQMVEFIHKTEINSIVVDVKDDTGVISYLSEVPLVKQIGSARRKYNPVEMLEILRQNEIYPIARIVVFKDPLLAAKRTDMAVKSSLGGLWTDFKGLCWVDPYNKAIWNYNIEVAKEAAALGFKEIQFDYVRFTSDGLIKYCRYPGADGRLKSDVIRDFLKYAYQELNPLGVKVSADLFGLTCSAQDDLGIGQVLEKVADIVCPMVYPSHYVKGAYNLADPELKPYDTVYQSLVYARKKLDNSQRKVIIRPWLQDFSLKSHYGREQLLAQIKAVQNAGLSEWIFWNPTNKYDFRKYRLKSEVQEGLNPPEENGSNPVEVKSLQ
jgi:hypothetical protein